LASSGIPTELDLLGLLEATIVSEGRRGHTKGIKILIDDETIALVAREDPQLLDVL